MRSTPFAQHCTLPRAGSAAGLIPLRAYARRPKVRKHACTAFTLVELVIVVLIISIIAVVGMPAVGDSFNRMRLRGAAKTLVADLNYARNLAITQGRNCGLSFSSTGYAVFVVEADQAERSSSDDGFAFDIIDHPITHRPWRVDLSARSVTVSPDFGNDGRMTFDSSGAPDPAGSVTLRSGGGSITVAVEAGTGRVSAQ